MLPVLDISTYLTAPNSTAGQEFVKKLRDTCHGPGFFYLIGHGVTDSKNKGALDIAKQFFNLPLAERQKLAIEKSPHFRGYTMLENEITNGRTDWREQIDIGPEEPAPTLQPEDPPWLRLRGPNQWPASLPQMADIINDWMAHMQPVGMALMRALAQGLGQNPHHFDTRIQPDNYAKVKISRYPAQPAHEETKQALGLHHDSGLLTFILQDAVPGLQVMSDGKLIDVTPMPGAYVVNLGEMMQSATSGYLRATKHQVVTPPAGQERISIAYFLNPRLETRFEPIELPAALAAEAPGGQNTDPGDPVIATFGANTLKIRMRSHPKVRAAFYKNVELADLIES